MSAGSSKLNEAQALIDTLGLDDGWQAKVLLRFSDPLGLLPQAWPEVSTDDWLKVLAKPAELFVSEVGARLVQDGRSSQVLQRRLQLGQTGREVFCKQSRRRNLLRKAIGLLRRTRPSRNWRIGWALLAAGIPTALPLAVLEKRVAGLRVATGIVTQSLLPGKTLGQFILQEAPELSVSEFRRLAKELAELFARLHEHNFFHRDLKGINIFVHFNDKTDPRFYLLDLDGCRANGRSYLKKVKSLERFARDSLAWPVVTHTARLRFLKNYLAASSNSGTHWKTWWQSIDRQVRRKLRPQDIA